MTTTEHTTARDTETGDAVSPLSTDATENIVGGLTKGDLFTSFDVADFDVPSHRDENWRFVPLRRLRGLHDGSADITGDYQVTSTHGDVVSVESVPLSDERIGRAGQPSDRVAAHAASHASEALVVTVPAEARVGVGEDTPLTLTLEGPGEGITACGHLHICLEHHAEAVLVIDARGSGSIADNIEYYLGEGSQLTAVILQDYADDAVALTSHHVSVGRDASVKHSIVTLGGDVVRNNVVTRFRGEGGAAELLGLYFADDGQFFENRLLTDHSVPNCTSNVLYKGALQGDPSSSKPEAHTVWVGDALIRAEAENTDTYELNRNLILTEGARADSVPNLEIATGEIIGAGHASAIGRFDDDQLFYLASRGIPDDVARRLVVRGFFHEIIMKLGVPSLKEHLTDAIEAELDLAGV